MLVVDGYKAYETAAKALDADIETAICWSHARRKLVDAEESSPEASEALDLIGEMFLLERNLPDWQAITDPNPRAQALAQIREVRVAKTRPLVEAPAAWAKAQRVPSSTHRLRWGLQDPVTHLSPPRQHGCDRHGG